MWGTVIGTAPWMSVPGNVGELLGYQRLMNELHPFEQTDREGSKGLMLEG